MEANTNKTILYDNFCYISLGMSATGRTLSEDPMTMSRSHTSLSCSIWRWNSLGRLSPKNTMSGFMIAIGSVGGHWGHRGITYRQNMDINRLAKSHCIGNSISLTIHVLKSLRNQGQGWEWRRKKNLKWYLYLRRSAGWGESKGGCNSPSGGTPWIKKMDVLGALWELLWCKHGQVNPCKNMNFSNTQFSHTPQNTGLPQNILNILILYMPI